MEPRGGSSSRRRSFSSGQQRVPLPALPVPWPTSTSLSHSMRGPHTTQILHGYWWSQSREPFITLTLNAVEPK